MENYKLGMNKRIYKRLILITITIFLITSQPVVSKSLEGKDINFKSISIEDGLSQTSVEYMFQDSRGYMWIGTADGLNRYNGYEFEVYRYKDDEPDSISSNYIAGINEDKDGNMWVATSVGLNKINWKTNKVDKYLPSNEGGSISHYNICEILIDSKDRIWVGTVDGLNVYNKELDKFERVLYDEKSGPVLSNQTVYSVQEDNEGRIWIGTLEGVNIYDENTNTISYITENLKEGKAISDNDIYDIYIDTEDYIWVGTFEGGLNRINIQTLEVDIYKNDNNPGSLPGNFVTSIMKDRFGTLWVGTDNGLAKLNEDTNDFTIYNARMYDSSSLINDTVLSLTQDSTGMVWVGTYGGISIFNPKNLFTHYKNDPFNDNSLSDNLIAGIHEESEKRLWVGTVHNGINIINKGENKVEKITTDTEIKLSSDEIRDITGDSNNIYIATNKGLNIYNIKSKKIEIYTTKNSQIIDDDIKGLQVGSDNSLWIGTKDGICKYTPNGEFKDYTYILDRADSIDRNVISIHEDTDGEIWIGLAIEGGVVRYNPHLDSVKTYKKKDSNNSLSFNSVKDINEDSKGNMWIATNYGLNKLDKQTEQFTNYTTRSGLDNDFIYGVLIDNNDNPWVSTNYGISKLDVKEDKFINFNITDGLQSNEFNGYAYHKNSRGEMFFGGINGLNSFNPEEFSVDKYITKVQIDTLEIQGKKIQALDEMKLQKDQDQFIINFFLPDYTNISKNQYIYKLEGVDEEWIYSGKKNYVSYANLKHGEYVFKVRSRNSSGIWSDITEMKIIIPTPLSRTPIAYTVYIALIILFAYIVWNRVKLLDSLVKERTREIEVKTAKNEELLKKLIENERYKNNYFVNLSHELRTPLNVILSTEQLITTLNKKEEAIDKSKLDYYMGTLKRNSNRLLNLINNIIDTSKIGSGTYRLKYKRTDIILLVEEVVLSMSDYAKEKGIDLIIDPEMEERIIQCDASEVEKCVVNIIANAIKFTSKGGEIYVSIWEENNYIMIAIKDTGIGIDKKYHKSIFDRFGQAYGEASEEYGGSGLGLTLTKQLINLHKGELLLESKLGEGSKFTIKLPINQ